MKKIRIALRERRALNCFVSGDYEKAERHFLAVKKIDPSRNGINHNLGLTAMALGRFEEAETRFLQDLRELGEFFPRIKVIADLYYAWGRRSDAEAFYRRALESGASEGTARLIEHRIKMSSDEESYSRALEAAALLRKGNGLMAEERWEEALELFREAWELDGTNLPALNNIGVILMNRRKDYRTAAEIFREGLELERNEWFAANLQKALRAEAEAEGRRGRPGKGSTEKKGRE